MQDRTIDNALVEIWRKGGGQAVAAEILLVMRGVAVPTRRYDRVLAKAGCRSIVLAALADGHVTTSQVADRIQERLPGISRRSANNRAYCALLRLEDKGLVRREGRVWGLAL